MINVDSLYHYCGLTSFVSIVQSRSIRLSSLNLSNDRLEGRLVNAAVMRLAVRNHLDDEQLLRLRKSLAFTENYIDGLGFCLSEEADLLSQWRGYADDANGVAIGFSRAYLEAFATSSNGSNPPGFALQKVEYELNKHENMLAPIYLELRKSIDAGAFKPKGRLGLLDSRNADEILADDKKIEDAYLDLKFRLLDFLPRLYELKALAFREEREWRIIAISGTPYTDCQFRATRDRVIPFRTIELAPQSIPVINEVILGPKNQTPIDIIRSMLRAGFGEVPVRNSAASYR